MSRGHIDFNRYGTLPSTHIPLDLVPGLVVFSIVSGKKFLK
jgi:hypothetical protein